jgi:tetratricopeptide (TPR) repeat protein
MKKIIIILLLCTFTSHSTPTMETAFEYKNNEQFTDAIACYEEIIQHEPTNINAYFHLGCCYLSIGDKEKTIAAFTKALEIDPHSLPAKYNLAYSYKTFGDIDMAITLYKEILAENPDYEQAQLALGFAQITQGNFDDGWEQHKRYLIQHGKNGDKMRSYLKNDTIAYKKVLLHPEGGLGDTINFIRYAERLKSMGADVIVVCQKQLVPLLSRCEYIDQLITSNAQIPKYDADATLMSLPAIFADNENTVPQNIPYIFADPALVTYWQQQLATDPNFKVGLCWQVDVHNDKPKLPIGRRGYPLECFVTLGNLKNVSFYSLQKYDGTEQLSTLSQHFPLYVFENFDDASGPFMDAAALIKNLDLVITVDTAIAHLAGAMGVPVWLLHPYATADWRWISGKNDSYWYPTMRIFKQHAPFDYDAVLQEVKSELKNLVQK